MNPVLGKMNSVPFTHLERLLNLLFETLRGGGCERDPTVPLLGFSFVEETETPVDMYNYIFWPDITTWRRTAGQLLKAIPEARYLFLGYAQCVL